MRNGIFFDFCGSEVGSEKDWWIRWESWRVEDLGGFFLVREKGRRNEGGFARYREELLGRRDDAENDRGRGRIAWG